jgi:glycosyltransferase involved in cell wall biosynthesis
MTILVVSADIPMPDRTSGFLRLTRILEWLARHEKVYFAHTQHLQQLKRIGAAELNRYRAGIEALGIRVIDPHSSLKMEPVRCFLFESHGPANHWMTHMRVSHPSAIVLVDSVDVNYVRLATQAQCTGERRSFRRMHRVRKRELTAYRAANLVVNVSEEDARVLQRDIPGLRTFIIPNIHRIPQLDPEAAPDASTLIFIGGFSHEPNVDAILWFCKEILPLIAASVPEVCLKIIGSNEPRSIRALAGPRIEVLGFVPDTTPYLRASAVSVAPLRFGAGLKGKIGEALAHGVPVVSTTLGISGFGLTPGVNVLVGDTARTFADEAIRLLRDPILRTRLGTVGREFVSQHYSEAAVDDRLDELFNTVVPSLTPLTLPGKWFSWIVCSRYAVLRRLTKLKRSFC